MYNDKEATPANSLHYHDYLQLDALLNAQQSESEKHGRPAHDEMLFIIIHQAYELWFKQLHVELDSIRHIMRKPALNDNSPELQTVVHRLGRMNTILKLLVQQIDVMETMTPMDFLDFRDDLRPASGFQSWQFKLLEAKLGLKFEHRHGLEYYTAQLKPEHVALIKGAEADQSLLQLVAAWLERMPEWYPGFWKAYGVAYAQSLAEVERDNLQYFASVFESGREASALSPKAARAALFIMLYRGYPLLHLPFQLINALLEADENLSLWRNRHMNMVHRIIGTRVGTGGSTGRDYLKAAADKHYIFKEFAQLTSFLMERSRLPALPKKVAQSLGFAAS